MLDVFSSDPLVDAVVDAVPAWFRSYTLDPGQPVSFGPHFRNECDQFIATGDDSALSQEWDGVTADQRHAATMETIDEACLRAGVVWDDLGTHQQQAIVDRIHDKDTDDTYRSMMRGSTAVFTKQLGTLDMSGGALTAIAAKARSVGANVLHPDVRSTLKRAVELHGDNWGSDSGVALVWSTNMADVGAAVADGEARRFEARLSVDGNEFPVGTVHTSLTEGEVSVHDQQATWHDGPRPKNADDMRDKYGFYYDEVVEYGTNSVTYSGGRTVTVEGNTAIESNGIRTTTVTMHSDGSCERYSVTRARNFTVEQKQQTAPDGSYTKTSTEFSKDGDVQKFHREELDATGLLTIERGASSKTSTTTKWPDGTLQHIEESGPQRREVNRSSTSYRESVVNTERSLVNSRSVDISGGRIVAVSDNARGTVRAELVRDRHMLEGHVVRADGSIRPVRGHHIENDIIDATLELLKD